MTLKHQHGNEQSYEKTKSQDTITNNNNKIYNII